VVVRIPSFARRSDAADMATEDRNQDGRIDERDERPAAETRAIRREQVDDRGSRERDQAAPATGVATVPTDVETRRDRARTVGAERAAAERAAERADADRVAVERDRVATEEHAPAGPRPRASLLATLGLVVGVAAAMLVLSGVLAGYGLALGIFGLLLSIGGLSATGKRHVAGKSDAVFGMALNVGAMIFGALALTGALSWLTTETNTVDQVRQWLDTQFADRV
jgi:hypothetical protein